MNARPTEQVVVQTSDAGKLTIAPPTFLERWGVVFVACTGAWILLVGSGILVYFLRYQPAIPNFAGLSTEAVRESLSAHKQIYDQ